ncbi:MAG: AMP-binding protein [Alphaproteobacteria bacterium]|nr:AMP-binding protein [Alphaproteobacteria bacterium]
MTLATIAAASGEEIVPLDITRADRSVFHALLTARAEFGGKTVALVDGDERTLTYNDLTQASFALGHALKKGTRSGDAVGILLPTSAGAVIAFFALSAYGRVPAMLNFTSGVAGLKSAVRTAQVRRVITARRFLKLAKLEELVSGLRDLVEFVYLEDVRANLSLTDKIAAVVGRLLPGLVACRPGEDAPAVFLFTSGTEGEPKAVALSHRNLLSNAEQVRSHLAIYRTDILFNPLPTFHSFGLTVGVLMPLMLGIRDVLHPTPLQPHEIMRRIKASGATILLSTDTFISQYARAGEPGDLSSVRLAVCGAERLREETRALLVRKQGLELLEGYGVTEASPVIAANQPGANRHGTVGHLMQGIEARLEPVEGMPNAGRLQVKGPNIMLGYVLAGRPGIIQPPPNGWHDTGDIVSIDEEGFITIRGRLKRFAKLGGEIVSLAVVENCASALWPEHRHASVAVPDSRKGEQIVLVTTCPGASRADVLGWAQDHGVPEIAVPRRIVHVDEVPILGTGKTDYVRVQSLAAERLQEQSLYAAASNQN